MLNDIDEWILYSKMIIFRQVWFTALRGKFCQIPWASLQNSLWPYIFE